VSWTFEGKGGSSAEVTDVEEAGTALREAVTETFGDMGSDALVALMGAIQGLRLSMVTDGWTAVEHGDEWSAQVGGILVTLSP